MFKETITQKIRKSGGSWGIIIPANTLKELKISNDDIKAGIEIKCSISRTANDILRMRKDAEILKMVDKGGVIELGKGIVEGLENGKLEIKEVRMEDD